MQKVLRTVFVALFTVLIGVSQVCACALPMPAAHDAMVSSDTHNPGHQDAECLEDASRGCIEDVAAVSPNGLEVKAVSSDVRDVKLFAHALETIVHDSRAVVLHLRSHFQWPFVRLITPVLLKTRLLN